jgi:hypothetical protein
VTPAQFTPDKQQAVTASASMDGVGASQECGAMIGREILFARTFWWNGPQKTSRCRIRTSATKVSIYPLCCDVAGGGCVVPERNMTGVWRPSSHG